MKILVTGGAGFIGSNFIRFLVNKTDYEIINYDILTYAGNLQNLKDLERNSRYVFFRGDILNSLQLELFVANCDAIVHFAAESHVDRSLSDANKFIQTNVLGTYNLLEVVRKINPKIKFLHVSTDEVYGDIAFPSFPTECNKLDPSSPYAASKASSDLLVLASHKTNSLNTIVSRCTNNYGPYQYPEKLIPLFICNAILDEPLPLYDGGSQIRDWLRVEDHCEALFLLLQKGSSGEIYNIGANQNPEISNLWITKTILKELDKPCSLIQHVKGLRPGHDKRYAVDTSKIRRLGWKPKLEIYSGLLETIEWYKNNKAWWEPLKEKNQDFFIDHYGK